MTLIEIYNKYTVGSQGFCTAVYDNLGFSISRDEIKRIAEKTQTAEQFQAVWYGEDWWKDENALQPETHYGNDRNRRFALFYSCVGR